MKSKAQKNIELIANAFLKGVENYVQVVPHVSMESLETIECKAINIKKKYSDFLLKVRMLQGAGCTFTYIRCSCLFFDSIISKESFFNSEIVQNLKKSFIMKPTDSELIFVMIPMIENYKTAFEEAVSKKLPFLKKEHRKFIQDVYQMDFKDQLISEEKEENLEKDSKLS